MPTTFKDLKFSKRRIDETVFLKWTPKMAYLLGQFKAGANFDFYKNSSIHPSGTFHSITFSTTNLQHLIKLQLLLNSDHRIVYSDYNLRKHGGTAKMTFIFGFRNALIANDLRKFGFVPTEKGSAKNNAPLPTDMPNDLLCHYVRGYIDERGCPMKDKRGIPHLNISGTSSFLLSLSNVITDKLGIETRTIYKKRYLSHREEEKSYFIIYNGFDQVRSIFKFLYQGVPDSLYCIERYDRMCKICGFNEDYANINVSLDVKTLYLLHQICCERRIDPNILIKRNMGLFMEYCKAKNLLPNDKRELIEEGKEIALNFGYSNSEVNWSSIFNSLYEAYTS